MEHARFMMIDPNDGMIVMLAHGKFLFWRSLDLVVPSYD
jgi:hypothetical protein